MRYLKEPLFHFLIMGFVIFAWFQFLNPETEEPADPSQIVIDTQDVDRLLVQFQAVWKRAPTMDEFLAMIDALVREEVLVREAEALGLDQNDGLIRKRLVQKMEFLTASAAQLATPDDDVLRAFLNDNPDQYLSPPRIAFEQVFLGQSPTEDMVRATLEHLKAGADAQALGQRTLLPPVFSLSDAGVIESNFGTGFFGTLSDVKGSDWSGPIRSSFGWHFVRIQGRKQGSLPPFEDLREKILSDWRREMSDTLSTAQLKVLKDQYDIQLPDVSGFEGQLQQ